MRSGLPYLVLKENQQVQCYSIQTKEVLIAKTEEALQRVPAVGIKQFKPSTRTFVVEETPPSYFPSGTLSSITTRSQIKRVGPGMYNTEGTMFGWRNDSLIVLKSNRPDIPDGMIWCPDAPLNLVTFLLGLVAPNLLVLCDREEHGDDDYRDLTRWVVTIDLLKPNTFRCYEKSIISHWGWPLVAFVGPHNQLWLRGKASGNFVSLDLGSGNPISSEHNYNPIRYGSHDVVKCCFTVNDDTEALYVWHQASPKQNPNAYFLWRYPLVSKAFTPHCIFRSSVTPIPLQPHNLLSRHDMAVRTILAFL